MNKKQFNNKIFFAILILSAIVAVIVTTQVEALQARGAIVFCVALFIGMMTYNGLLIMQEKKHKTEDNQDDNENTDNDEK